MSLRALAFGNLQPGQAKAGQSLGVEALPGGRSGQPSTLPGEGADTTGLPTLSSLSPTSLGLLARGGATTTGGVPLGTSDQPGASSGQPTGEVPSAPSDTPVSPVSTLPGFQAAPSDATAAAGQTVGDPQAFGPAPFGQTAAAQAAVSDVAQSAPQSHVTAEQLSGLAKLGSNQLGKYITSAGSGAGAVAGSQLGSEVGGIGANEFAIEGALGAGELSDIGAEAASQAGTEGATGLAGGGIMAAFSAIPTVWASINDFMQAQAHAKAQLNESKGIRSNAQTAWPAYSDASNTLSQVQAVDPNLPPQQQIEALLKLAGVARYQLDQAPAMSQYISTQGGRQTHAGGIQIPAVDTSGIESVSGKLSRDAVLAYTAALDRLAKLGVNTTGSQENNFLGDWNPQGLLGILMAQGGAPQIAAGPQQISPEGEPGFNGDYRSLLTPEESQSLAAPGGRLNALQALLSRLNPGFGQTDLSAEIQALLPGQAAGPAGAPAAPPSPSLLSLGGVAVNPTAAALALQKKKDEENAALQGVP